MLRKFLNPFLGKKKYYHFWEKVYELSLSGMNMNLDGIVSNSGESNVLPFVLANRRENGKMIVFDVGANKGQYALECIRKMKEYSKEDDVEIYCFEPSKTTYKLLDDAVRGYSQLHIYNIGLGDVEGIQTLFYDAAGSGLASLYQRDLREFKIVFNQEETVQITQLDIFCERNGISYIDLLKMDVEGNELNVLKGGERILQAGNVGAIQIEFGGCNVDARTFLRDFWNMLHDQYVFYRIMQDGFAEIIRYSEKLENFTNSNLFLLRR